MFRLSAPSPSSRAPAVPDRRLLRRAGLLAAALVLLWGAVRLMPPRPAPALPPGAALSAAVDAGTVAGGSSARMVSPGMLAALALLAAGGGFAWWLRRRPGGGEEALPLRSVGQLALAPNQQLRLVRCGADVLLLGVTAGQITLLKEFPADAFDPKAVPPAPAFADVLRAHGVAPSREAAEAAA